MRLFYVLLWSLLVSTASFAQRFEQKQVVNFQDQLDTAPEFIEHFALPWMNHADPNVLWKSEDYANAVYVLEAYFNTCPYCNENAPQVDDLATMYSMQERVKIVDLGYDTRASDYRAWIAKHHPNHPVLNDGGRQVIGPLGIDGFPTTVILDCRMREIYRKVGLWDSAAIYAIRRAIDTQLQSNCQ